MQLKNKLLSAIFLFIFSTNVSSASTDDGILDRAVNKLAKWLDESNEAGEALIAAKLDTLGATVKAIEAGFNRMSNQKYYQLENMHLRLVLELRYKTGAQPIGRGDFDCTNEAAKRYYNYTNGWCGGHSFNANWVSGLIPYDQSKDYEFPRMRFTFDESNPLPTAKSKSKTNEIAKKLLK